MNDELEIVVGPGVVEIDAEKIVQIIRAACPIASEAGAAHAANLIVEHLIEVHQNASERQ